ncbi:MAG: phosphatase PAP2 family protein [Muribaculaceae bacterium]|nr:phosphatase PAP2 family protein [Muribaculaceae bacterium]
MIQYLQDLDTQILLFINGLHVPYLDRFMWLATTTVCWSLMFIVLLYVLGRRGWKQLLAVVVAIALVILIADMVSAAVIKPLVARLRPSHDPDLSYLVHVVNGYRGGRFSFVSSHAANTFAGAALISLIFRNRRVTISIFLWALIECYSRMYLGVHYLGDLVCGALLGCAAAWLVYALLRRYWLLFHQTCKELRTAESDARMVAGGMWANLLVLAIIAIF